MRTLLRPFVSVLLCLCLLSGTAIAGAPQTGMVIDTEKTTLVRISTYIDDLTALITPFITPRVLESVNKHQPLASGVLAGLLEAKIRAVTAIYTQKGFFATVTLPEGDLSLMAQGDLSADSLRRAYGNTLVDLLGGMMGTLPKPQEVAPKVYQCTPDFCFAVEGKTIVAASSVELVELCRNKLRNGEPVAPMPNKGQNLWSKTSYNISHAPTKEGPFKSTQIDDERIGFFTPEGMDYTINVNAKALLPGMASMEPIAAANLPFFGGTDQFLTLAFTGSVWNVVKNIALKGENPVTLQQMTEGVVPFPLDEVKGLSLTLGGANTSLMGVAVPGLYVTLEASDAVLDTVQALIKTLSPSGWNEIQMEGWNSVSTVETLALQGTPLPVPAFMARRNGQLCLGSLDKTSLVPATGTPDLIKGVPADGKYSVISAVHTHYLWNKVRETLAPGTMLRTLAKIDAKMTPEQAAAFNALLAMPFPMREQVQWSTPDMSETTGFVRWGEDPQRFFAGVCDLVDTFLSPQMQAPEQAPGQASTPEQAPVQAPAPQQPPLLMPGQTQ